MGYVEELGLSKGSYDFYRYFMEVPPRLGLLSTNIKYFMKKVVQRLKTFRPDICFIVKGEFLSENDLKAIREYSVVVLFNTDDPRFFLKTGGLEFLASNYVCELVDSVDLIATPSEPCIKFYRRVGVKDVLFLPFACNPDLHYVPLREECNRVNVVTFIGAMYRRRLKVLMELIRNNVPVLVFSGDKAYSRVFRRYFIGRGVWGRRYALIHAASRLSLNIHAESDLNWKANMRVFEVLASGGVLLTDNGRVVSRFFEAWRDFIPWEEKEDLVELVKVYLNADDDEIQGIARGGQSKVMKEHKYNDRVATLLKYVKGRFV